MCRLKVVVQAASNGSSEMATSLVTGIITLMFNWTLLKYAGENGVAAVTIIMYVLMFASSLYTGYSYGIAPMISYSYGEANPEKLQRLIRSSLKIITFFSVITVLFSFIFTPALVSIFVRQGEAVYDLAVTGNRICTIALLFIGFNVFASGLFTALSNGFVSALLAFSRSFVFMLIAMLLLPVIFGVNGIWMATPAAELLAFIMSCIFFIKYKKQYKY